MGRAWCDTCQHGGPTNNAGQCMECVSKGRIDYVKVDEVLSVENTFIKVVPKDTLIGVADKEEIVEAEVKVKPKPKASKKKGTV